jgi:hypothetical protein
MYTQARIVFLFGTSRKKRLYMLPFASMDVAVAVHTKNQFYPTNLVVSAPLREDTKLAKHAE